MSARNWLVLIALSLIWGFSFLFIKVGVEGFSPVWVTAIRIGVGTLCLLFFLRLRGHVLPERRFWPLLVVASAFNNVLPWLLLSWAELSVSSGLASILNATTPLFSIIIASTWGDETLDAKRVLGVGVGIAGVSLLMSGDLGELGGLNLLPEIAVLAASALYALGASYVRRYLRAVPSQQVAAGQLAGGILIILPFLLLEGAPATVPELRVIGAVVALGVFGTGIAYLLFFHLIQEVGATRTLVVTLLVPLTALFWGWLLLDEVVDWRTIAGMAIVLLGVILVNGDSFRRMLIPARGEARNA